MRSPQVWVSGRCTKWQIKGSFHSSSWRSLNVNCAAKRPDSLASICSDKLAQCICHNMNCAPWKQDLHSRWNFITTSPSNMAVVMKNDQLKWRQKHAVFPAMAMVKYFRGLCSMLQLSLLCCRAAATVWKIVSTVLPTLLKIDLLKAPLHGCRYALNIQFLHLGFTFWGRSTDCFHMLLQSWWTNHPHAKNRNPIVLPTGSATKWLFPERTSSLTENSFCLSRYQACQRIHYCHWGGEAWRSGTRPVLQFKDNRSTFTRYGQVFPGLRSIVCAFSQWELVV